MALEGTIKDFGLPDIFQLIGLQRKTGILSLTNEEDEETVTVTFENGMVVMTDSSANRLEDRLGNVLVKQGKLSRERLDEALGVQRQTLQRLGHILATGSAITQKDLKDALNVQVSQIVFRVFRWRDGKYQFTPADTVDWDRENFVPMSADFILMEGIRMVDEWPIIEKKIPSFDVVFRPVVDPSLIEVGTSGADDVTAVLVYDRPWLNLDAPVQRSALIRLVISRHVAARRALTRAVRFGLVVCRGSHDAVQHSAEDEAVQRIDAVPVEESRDTRRLKDRGLSNARNVPVLRNFEFEPRATR